MNCLYLPKKSFHLSFISVLTFIDMIYGEKKQTEKRGELSIIKDKTVTSS
jgi:hypothetical protein